MGKQPQGRLYQRLHKPRLQKHKLRFRAIPRGREPKPKTSSAAMAYEHLCFSYSCALPGCQWRACMGSTEKRVLQSVRSPLRKLKAATASGLWVALTIAFAAWSPAAAADGPTGKPQIQGGNVRIEYDNHLRSRV